MPKQRKIAPASNNTEKHDAYTKLKSKYKKAVKSQFYLEALLINYAIIEEMK